MTPRLLARRVSGGSSLPAVPLDSSEARTLLQTRLALYGLVTGTLSAAFWVVKSVITPAFVDQDWSILWNPVNAGHLSAIAVHWGTWLACRRGRLPWPLLLAIDAISTVGAAAAYSAVVPVYAGRASSAELVPLLCLMGLLLARAILLPSTPLRTLWIGVGAAVPVVAVPTIHVAAMRADPVGAGIYLGSWSGVAVALSTFASRMIFGLSQHVQRARQLGQYTLTRRLGAGGMGEVYAAQHAMLRRPTAVKLIRPEVVGEEALARFEREVTLTARLTHPNTIAIYDYGRTADGVFYYAMEYLDGHDLEDLIALHGPMPPERVVHVMCQACESLAEAHDLGLVHRDIKPGNLVLCTRGRRHDVLKVVDFGLVKDIASHDALSLSGANAITGTPHYIAPESISAPDRIDGRADLYALGAVGWFLLTGRPVFDSPSVVEVCAAHLHETPRRPSEATGRPVPPGLEDALMRCLAKDPAARFADADALRAALDGTGLVARWTAERAARWWDDHHRFCPTDDRQPPSSSKVVALHPRRRASA